MSRKYANVTKRDAQGWLEEAGFILQRTKKNEIWVSPCGGFVCTLRHGSGKAKVDPAQAREIQKKIAGYLSTVAPSESAEEPKGDGVPWYEKEGAGTAPKPMPAAVVTRAPPPSRKPRKKLIRPDRSTPAIVGLPQAAGTLGVTRQTLSRQLTQALKEGKLAPPEKHQRAGGGKPAWAWATEEVLQADWAVMLAARAAREEEAKEGRVAALIRSSRERSAARKAREKTPPTGETEMLEEATPSKRRVGIICFQEAAKGFVKALSDRGYEPEVLGGDPPAKRFSPARYHAIVCNTERCKHEAYHKAQAESRREGGTPVIFESSVTRVLASLADLEGVPAAVSLSTGGRPDSCKTLLLEAIDQGGLYYSRLLDRSPSQIVSLLRSVGTVRGRKQAARALEAFEKLKSKHPAASVGKRFSDLRALPDKGGLQGSTLWGTTSVGKEVPVPVLSKARLTSDQMTVLAEQTGLTWEAPQIPSSFVKSEEPATGTEPEAGADLPPEKEPLNAKPIHGAYHRGYYQKKQNNWGIRGRDPATPNYGFPRHLKVIQTRSDAELEILRLDEAWEVEHGAPTPEPAPVPAPAVAKAEPFDLPPPTPELLGMVPEPSVKEDASKKLLKALREHMLKEGLSSLEGEGLSVELLTVHLLSPEGAACNSSSGAMLRAKDITQVTCQLCKGTQFYKTVEFALANLTIGE